MAKKIREIQTLSKESRVLYDVVNNESDLPCVLITTSFLDQCLASILERFFINGNTAESVLDPLRGCLGSFAARADLCYCLGLIPKGLFRNLRTVGEIRNRFAHSYLSLTFDDPEVAHLCESLLFPKVTPESIKDPWAKFKHPREKFTMCVVIMANRLMLTGLSTKRRPKEEKGWD